jgi:hypothetical protein
VYSLALDREEQTPFVVRTIPIVSMK